MPVNIQARKWHLTTKIKIPWQTAKFPDKSSKNKSLIFQKVRTCTCSSPEDVPFDHKHPPPKKNYPF